MGNFFSSKRIQASDSEKQMRASESSLPMTKPYKVCIVGSGNWGSVIGKIVGGNVKSDPTTFDIRVKMYVYEEIINGIKLTEIINREHENVKYLPGCKIPENVVAVPDVMDATKEADILIFVVPHQFINTICYQMAGKIKNSAIAISLIKGLEVNNERLQLISSMIRHNLGIPCAVLMGANVANEVANENFCEATLGCRHRPIGNVLKELFQTPYFRIVVVPDEDTVEVCGALKNVVAMGAGFVDGLHYGDNTKAAAIRLGLMEMVSFSKYFFPETRIETFLESCGVADLVTTCYSGRNRKVAEAFAACTSGKTLADLELEMLNGQKLQGPPSAAQIYTILKKLESDGKHVMTRFPLFVAVHLICVGEIEPSCFIACLQNHPEHI